MVLLPWNIVLLSKKTTAQERKRYRYTISKSQDINSSNDRKTERNNWTNYVKIVEVVESFWQSKMSSTCHAALLCKKIKQYLVYPKKDSFWGKWPKTILCKIGYIFQMCLLMAQGWQFSQSRTIISIVVSQKF